MEVCVGCILFHYNIFFRFSRDDIRNFLGLADQKIFLPPVGLFFVKKSMKVTTPYD